MTTEEKLQVAAGGIVSGGLFGLSLAEIQTYVGIGVGILTACVLIQRIVINWRTLREPENSE